MKERMSFERNSRTREEPPLPFLRPPHPPANFFPTTIPIPRRPCNPDFLRGEKFRGRLSCRGGSFIQPRHGTPFVTILSIAVEQESDRGLSSPSASPSPIGPHRFFSISREDLLLPPSLPPTPINPFPRIVRVHVHCAHTAHKASASSKNSIETFDRSATATVCIIVYLA